MATYYARANGNVDATIWATTPAGAAANLFPTFTSADVLMANGFQVTINVNTTVAQIRNDNFGGATTNTTTRFNLSSVTLTADVITGSHSGADACVYINGTSPTINGNVFAGGTGGSLTTIDGHGIFINGAGSLTINGNVTGGTNNACTGINIYTASAYSVTVNGNVTGGTAAFTPGINFGLNNSGVVVNVNNGTISAGSNDNRSPGILCSVTGSTLNLNNCNLSPAVGWGMVISGNTIINITNSIITSSGASGANAALLSGTVNVTISGTTFTPTNRGTCITSTGGSFTITGNISSNYGIVLLLSNSTANITGNITACLDGGGASNAPVGTISISSGSLTINGNLNGSNHAHSSAISVTGSASATINGNATGGTQGTVAVSTGSHAIFSSTTGSVIVNGNVLGGTSLFTNSAIYNFGLGTIVINGTVTGGSVATGVRNLGGGTITLDKAVGNDFGFGSVGLSSVPGVINVLGKCFVKQVEYGNLGQSPTEGPISFIDLTSNVAIMYVGGTSGTKKTLFDSSSTADYPAVTDVRRGVVFANGNKTGTCLVPAAANVRHGVSVDNTTGTATLTQANIDAALSSFESGRLTKCATVDSTGQQLTDAVSGS